MKPGHVRLGRITAAMEAFVETFWDPSSTSTSPAATSAIGEAS